MKTKTGSDTLPAVIGIDIGKDVFHLVGFGADGTIALTNSFGGSSYRLHMTPDNRTVYAYPETDYLNVTCASVGANLQCNSWKIEPNGAKGGCLTADCSVRQNIVKLIKLVTSKGKTTEIDGGDFYMAFSIGVTNP